MDLSSPALEAARGRLIARFGAPVAAWWDRLPEAIAGLAERWELVVGDVIGRGNTSLVIRCRRADGQPAVMKLTPDAELGRAEASALRSWQASGRVPLVWAHEPASGALLLEAIANETPISDRRRATELHEVAELIDGLHRTGTPVTANGVVSLAARVDFIFEHWVERHGRGGAAMSDAVPVDRLRRGHELARRLATDAVPAVLLHGDLHPANVLDGGARRGLVAIDPRPCVGDAAFDAVDWVFWSVDEPDVWQLRSRNLALALGVEQHRLWSWCTAFAALLATAAAARTASSKHISALVTLAP